jgi:hypothetical protein
LAYHQRGEPKFAAAFTVPYPFGNTASGGPTLAIAPSSSNNTPSVAPAAVPAAQPAGPWSDTPGDYYSEGDVRFHVRNIVKKIKDRNRVEAF